MPRAKRKTPAEPPTGADSGDEGSLSSVGKVRPADDGRKDRVPRERLGVFDWRKKIREASVPSRAKLVGLTLSIYMNEEGGSCFPSLATLAADTSLNKETVVFGLDDLDAAGYIDRGSKDRRRGGSGRKTHYLATVPKLSDEPTLETVGEADTSTAGTVGSSAGTVGSSAKKGRVSRREVSKEGFNKHPGADDEKNDHSETRDPLVERLYSVVERNGPKIRAEAEALVAHFAAYVDRRLIDEAIGIAETLDDRPRNPRAVAPLIERNARGIAIPRFEARKKSA